MCVLPRVLVRVAPVGGGADVVLHHLLRPAAVDEVVGDLVQQRADPARGHRGGAREAERRGDMGRREGTGRREEVGRRAEVGRREEGTGRARRARRGLPYVSLQMSELISGMPKTPPW